METENQAVNQAPLKVKIRLSSILWARCPSCHKGGILKGIFAMHDRCPHCDYNLYPEPGFYLGAMVVGFLLTDILIVPPLIVMKIMNVDIGILCTVPFIEFIFIGSFLMFYSRILWLHIEHKMTSGLEGERRGAR
jgi:uncharacterized protein (DUF983 family)